MKDKKELHGTCDFLTSGEDLLFIADLLQYAKGHVLKKELPRVEQLQKAMRQAAYR